ncbi:DUF998 domain-containing protein [Sphaerisporangium rhizosphaerae]|uniref:DUF998 domain-containing protein n=1 Tax=Sphaerisporangium rhizosphaerae TaxID=2269375 RepID=A0ABW2P2Y1_9ACTN
MRPPVLRALLWGGVIAGPLFVAAFVIEGATRAGYDALRHPVSSLALGEYGWTQDLNFIVAGLLTLGFAVALWRELRGGGSGTAGQVRRGATWGPILIGVWAVHLITVGFFVTDPVSGYPRGTPDRLTGYATTHGAIHDLAAIPGFLCLGAAFLVFAVRFARQRAFGRAAYSVITFVVFVTAFMLANAAFGQTEGLVRYGGLFQRIAVVTGWLWLTLLAAHRISGKVGNTLRALGWRRDRGRRTAVPRVERMKWIGKTTAVGLAAAMVLTGALPVFAAPDTERGQVVSVTRLGTLSARQVAAALKGDQGGAWDTRKVRYGVETYRVVYRTVDASGRRTTASGLVALPRNGERRLRAVSFTHGTELFKGDAPSTTKEVWGRAPALTYASAGMAAVAPDYLGLGKGPGPHPWMDVPSETTASLDMLRAARRFASESGRQLRREVLVTGFSQGASAALGLARALQTGTDPWFRLGAVAPVSGAYAFRDTELPALLKGRTDTKAGVIYAALTFVAFNRLHHLYDSPSEVFRAPYDRRMEKLLDGSHTGLEVVKGTPNTIDALLTPRGRAALAHPTGRLADALRVVDGVCAWKPKAPIRLYVAKGDEQAVSANSPRCRAMLRAHGATAPLVDLGTPEYGGSRHLGSQQAATAALVRWFTSLP